VYIFLVFEGTRLFMSCFEESVIVVYYGGLVVGDYMCVITFVHLEIGSFEGFLYL